MEEIQCHNMAGLCSQQYCDKIETHFINLDVCGFRFFVGFCKEHAEEFENKLGESKNA